jgi:hypothetical protein
MMAYVAVHGNTISMEHWLLGPEPTAEPVHCFTVSMYSLQHALQLSSFNAEQRNTQMSTQPQKQVCPTAWQNGFD